jgi:hypothetical protein
MGPIGDGVPAEGVLTGQPLASTPVQVRVEVISDLDGTNESIALILNGFTVAADLFRFDGAECPQVPSATLVQLTISQWNEVIAAAAVPGEVRVQLIASAAVSAAACPAGSSRVHVSNGGPAYDCDADGQPDACQLAAGEGDCDGNGLFDACETGGAGDTDADGTPDSCERAKGDINLDGVVNALDLSILLASWGSDGALISDIDGDGDVDGVDLSFLLARWGSVP